MTKIVVTPAIKKRFDVIRKLGKRTAADSVQIGKELLAIKASVLHGQWIPLLKQELGWKETPAKNYMQIAKKFGKVKSPNLGVLSYGASLMQQLSSDRADDLREEVIERTERGSPPSREEIQRRIARLPPRPARTTERQFDADAPENRVSRSAARVTHLVLTIDETIPLLEGDGIEDDELLELDRKLAAISKVVTRILKRRRLSSLRVIQGGRS